MEAFALRHFAFLAGFLAVVVPAQAATVATEYPDYAPGETVVITGSGWEPGETVVLVLHEDPPVCADRQFTADASESGDIHNAEFVVDEHDLGVTFTLVATGLTSGLTAETTFTDACPAGMIADETCPLSNLANCTLGCRLLIGPNAGNCALTQVSPAPRGTLCRAQTDVCDVAETCTGFAFSCPADGVAASTTGCRGPVGPCDRGDFCTGIGKACPPDAFLDATRICRVAAGGCDTPEACSGASADCPPDAVSPALTVCRASNGVCDVEERCSGTSPACPADGFLPEGTICRPAASACDVPESCTPEKKALCPSDHFKPEDSPCGDPTVTACSGADTCNRDGQCLLNNEACALVTDSALCPFDVNLDKGTCVGGPQDGQGCKIGNNRDACVRNGGLCVASNQFRLIFTPDVQNWVAYKLNGSNPGQFFYNLIADGTPGDTVDLAISIPYPFITHGAVPVHIYDGDVPLIGGCFAPGLALATSNVQIGLGDWLAGTSNGTLDCDQVLGPNGSGTCRFTVSALIPPSGAVYVNVHLDFGLKGPMVDANPLDAAVDRYDRGLTVSPWATYDALKNTSTDNGSLALRDCRDFDFSHENLSTAESFADTVQNLNAFKNIAGVFGQVFASATGSPAAGAHMQLVKGSAGAVVATTTADADGSYGMSYKHRGSPATYTVYVLDHGLARSVQLSGNGWAEVSFDVTTGTSSVSQKK